MENDLDKDQDHKVDQDFLDLIVKNYRHMKRVEIYITRDELALNLSPGRPIVSIPNVQILSELSLSILWVKQEPPKGIDITWLDRNER